MQNRLVLLAFSVLLLSTFVAAQRVSKVDFAKKIADATPAALPQSPVEKRPSTDARDAALRGKIKSVIEYNQTAGSTKREPYKEDYYDEKGNLTRTVHYDEGYPHSVIVWGYIEGMRVNRSGDIVYAKGEKPPPKHLTIVQSIEGSTKDPSAPRDTRYQIRHVHEYDGENRLIEKRQYQNNGDLWMRTTYTYEGKTRLERDFMNDGDEISKTRETLDAASNVVEQLMYGADDEPPSKYVMKHQFDPHGNWIVERTYEETTVRKRKIQKLLWTSYRTIEYYR